MNILYIAFSCQPNKGSEEKIGWSIPFESSKYNNVFVITREEQRDKIEKYVKEKKLNNIKFYYVNINENLKKLLKGPLFSLRLNQLHKKAFPLAEQICKAEKIDIIHQITPIEFRSIGNYGKIKNVKFVCGPVGGGEYIPDGLQSYINGNRFTEFFRKTLNVWCKFKYIVSDKLRDCDWILFANKETRDYLEKATGNINSSLYTEIGLSPEDIVSDKQLRTNKKTFTILVAGHFSYRKGHKFLFDALKLLPENTDYVCRIAGDGPYEKILKEKCRKSGLDDKVEFCGRVTYEKMSEEYDMADIFIMPSLRETTGTVVLEAMSHGLPVVTLNKFGALNLLDFESSWLIDGKSKVEYICNLKNVIVECMSYPDEVAQKGSHARELAYNHTWQKKVAYYQEIYDKITQSRV